ncbi:unnamed protein product [Cylicostephanus goldi]|uniref:Uncharacterized protein n=1 Tax=Cylicostephanus goldi TaxID=71465 RepID=A0A3P6UT88_CYLGO|nr:unnamed protein product [Cylicostephanus goldi]
MRAEETGKIFDEDEIMKDITEECSPTKDRDDRSLGELLAAGRKGTSSVADSPLIGTTDTTPRVNPSHRPLHADYVLDKVRTESIFGILYRMPL